ncbi:uncharacterized protein LOC120328158 [Styela clava]
MRSLIVIYLFVGISWQCQDLGGEDYCRFTLLRKSNMCEKLVPAELAQCLKTCGVCKEKAALDKESNVPAWAVAPPTPRQPMNPKRRRPEKKDEEPIALPLYAVIIIVIAVLVIFIGITVCVIKLKHKWKKRKMKKNKNVLRHAPVAPNTMPPHAYGWGTGSYNAGYHPDMDGWSRNMYLSGETDHYHQSQQHMALNNTVQQNSNLKKNINIVQNGTKDNKRKAPEPPTTDADSTYQNLQQATSSNKSDNAQKDWKGTKKNVAEIPIQITESAFSAAAPVRDGLQKNHASWNDDFPPIPPPRDPIKRERAATVQNKPYREIPITVGADEETLDGSVSVEDEDSDTSTVRMERSLSELTDHTQHTSPALANILNDWKEHLQEQKKELEDYYKSLALYVKRVGLKPAGEVMEDRPPPSNDRSMQEWVKTNQVERSQKHRNKSEAAIYSDRPYASIHENYSAMLKFPTPPESVRGDFTWEPNNEESQKQVVTDLKKKLARLQNLLESTQEMADSDKKSSAYYIPSQRSKSHKNQTKTELLGDRITIKVLLQKLEEPQRLKVQMRIAQALDTSRKRGGMNIASRDGPITCLSKQIHHVMNDILDPRTSTKIELGAHAACTLATKLLTNVHSNLLPVLNSESSKQNVARTTNRISILSKQLLDMTKQLMTRHSLFQSKDYSVFVNAFVDTTEKIMDTTFHLVCVIVDLQRAERRGLIKSQSQTTRPHLTQIQSRSVSQRQSLPQQGRQEKGELLSRLHSESNSTALSAVDVRRLNDDLAKLRQLLNTETQLPSLSEITIPRQSKFTHNHLDHAADDDFPLGYQYDGQDMSECDTMSTLSCSTCITENDDHYFYSDDIPPPPPPKFSAPPANLKRKQDGRVQYTDIIFDPEIQRPWTRPKKEENLHHVTMPHIQMDRPGNHQVALVSAQASNVESTKENQRKASSLDPSSFASFHSDRQVINNDDVQPRHQAMLARYFGGETMEPKNVVNENQKDNLQQALENPTTPAINQAVLPLVESENPDGDCPAVTMLPYGLVAQDTPPIVNPPKDKRVKLPKIPEITVVRNGENETNQSITPSTTEEPTNNFVESPNNAPYSEDLTDDPYSYTDTLPMHRKETAPISEDKPIDSYNEPQSHTSEDNSLKKDISVNYLGDDDYELHMPTSPKYVDDINPNHEADWPMDDNNEMPYKNSENEIENGEPTSPKYVDDINPNHEADWPIDDNNEMPYKNSGNEIENEDREPTFPKYVDHINQNHKADWPMDNNNEMPYKHFGNEIENEDGDPDTKLDSEEDSIASFSMSVGDILTDDESVVTTKMKSQSIEDDNNFGAIDDNTIRTIGRGDNINDGLISEFEFPRVDSRLNNNLNNGAVNSRTGTPKPEILLESKPQTSLCDDINKFAEDTEPANHDTNKADEVIYDAVCSENSDNAPEEKDLSPSEFKKNDPIYDSPADSAENPPKNNEPTIDENKKKENRFSISPKSKHKKFKMPKFFGKKK